MVFQRAGIHSFIVLFLPSHRIKPFSTNSVLRRTGSSTEQLWRKQRNVSRVLSKVWGRWTHSWSPSQATPNTFPVFSCHFSVSPLWQTFSFPFVAWDYSHLRSYNTVLTTNNIFSLGSEERRGCKEPSCVLGQRCEIHQKLSLVFPEPSSQLPNSVSP